MLLLLVDCAVAMCAMPPASMSPANGALDVPVDTRVVWSTDNSLQDDGPPTISDADGVAVAATVTWSASAGSRVYAVLVPEDPLAPDTTYTVADAHDSYTFTTGQGSGSAVPTVLVAASADADADYAHDLVCDGGSTAWEEGREHVYIDVVLDAPIEGYVEARVRVDDGADSYAIGGAVGVSLRDGGCSPSVLPDMDGAEQVTVSLRAVTYTGEASDWGDPFTVDVPWPTIDCPDPVAGCDTTGAEALGGLFVTVLLVGARRRVRGRP